ncbi:MAG: hypothetical protein EU530_00640 [Promethearchaeota archaeon]|nr:MAG: hypothetical protein EU530_00640 [Candidatus Lokiarchaeota archaeon]
MSGFDPLSPENRFEADDYDHFITELQRIINEAPGGPGKKGGMQAKFAKTIAHLKQKQNLVRGHHGRAVDNEELFKRLVEIVEKDLENASYDENKFENVFILTQLREFISEQKKKHRIK